MAERQETQMGRRERGARRGADPGRGPALPPGCSLGLFPQMASPGALPPLNSEVSHWSPPVWGWSW